MYINHDRPILQHSSTAKAIGLSRQLPNLPDTGLMTSVFLDYLDEVLDAML